MCAYNTGRSDCDCIRPYGPYKSPTVNFIEAHYYDPAFQYDSQRKGVVCYVLYTSIPVSRQYLRSYAHSIVLWSHVRYRSLCCTLGTTKVLSRLFGICLFQSYTYFRSRRGDPVQIYALVSQVQVDLPSYAEHHQVIAALFVLYVHKMLNFDADV